MKSVGSVTMKLIVTVINNVTSVPAEQLVLERI